MDLIDVQRLVVQRFLPPLLQPGLIAPLIAGDIINFGGGVRPGLRVKSIGVGLGQDAAVPGVNGVLVDVVALHPGQEFLPNSAVDLLHGAVLRVPAVEIPHNGDAGGIGSPHPEAIAVLAVFLGRMGAHKGIGVVTAAVQKTGDLGIGTAGISCVHRALPPSLQGLGRPLWYRSKETKVSCANYITE